MSPVTFDIPDEIIEIGLPFTSQFQISSFFQVRSNGCELRHTSNHQHTHLHLKGNRVICEYKLNKTNLFYRSNYNEAASPV